MATILTEIETYKRREIAEREAALPYAAIAKLAKAASPVRGFKAALERHAATRGHGLIAEIKKASPSKGLIRADFDPPSLARAYQAGGASCLSVLTDTPSFQGHDDFLSQARNACALPALRKDFLFTPYQVAESRALEADCILVIMASVTDAEARALLDETARWGMDALIEVHNEDELARALALGGDHMLGVNNRDLHDFVVDLAVTERLSKLVPPGRMLVSESGIYTNADITRLQKSGATAFLVGESLMRQADVEAAVIALLAATI
ncbi:MAG: indole-3-glycerol phosphate synthase TrpC [Micropepsaceae bacterium]